MRKRVSSIAEAIELAREGQQSGQWDLFRGQIDARWFVTSSLERLPESGRELAWQRFERFVAWAENVDPMARYFMQPDSLWAIAQHYGFATNFIDFTDDPKIAAFFASDTEQEPALGQEAAIVCLNSHGLIEFWKKISFISTPPEVIRIDVENLWRIQIQRGCFLWNPIPHIEGYYDFDRIVFPYVKTHQALPHRDEIYPKDQSALERHLSDFFMNEGLPTRKALNEHIKKNDLKFVHWFNLNYDAVSLDSSIVTTPDWSVIEDWRTYNTEHADDVHKKPLFEFPPSLFIDEGHLNIKAIFTSKFINENRRRAFGVISVSVDQEQKRLIACLRRLWNGMRDLPYSDLEIACAISAMLDIFAAANRGADPSNILGEESIEVEFCAATDGRGSYSRGTVTKSALLAAYNPSFTVAAQNKMAQHRFANFVSGSLQIHARPWQRFTFTGLRQLMVEQLIPTQVVFRGASDGEQALKKVIYFSPTDLNVFGLA